MNQNKQRISKIKPVFFPQLMYPEHAHFGNGEFVVLMNSSESGTVVWSDNEDFVVGDYLTDIDIEGGCYVPFNEEIILKND